MYAATTKDEGNAADGRFSAACQWEDFMIDLKGKKVIVLGERDGIQGPAIAACVKSAGAEALLVQTQCFV